MNTRLNFFSNHKIAKQAERVDLYPIGLHSNKGLILISALLLIASYNITQQRSKLADNGCWFIFSLLIFAKNLAHALKDMNRPDNADVRYDFSSR